MRSLPSLDLCRPNSMSCWLWFSYIKPWVAVGSNSRNQLTELVIHDNRRFWMYRLALGKYSNVLRGSLWFQQSVCSNVRITGQSNQSRSRNGAQYRPVPQDLLRLVLLRRHLRP